MTTALLDEIPRSPGIWAQAWKRLKNDRVGMVALGVTLLFIGLVVLAQLGWVASGWQRELGKPNAPPHWVGKSVDGSQTVVLEAPTGPNVDLSAIDPLAPRYAEWDQRASQFTTTDVTKSDTLPLGGDRLGRDVLDKAIKGAQVSIAVGLVAALFATLVGTLLGALAGYFGGPVDDFLEWVYNVFTAIPYILLVFALAAVLKSGPLASSLGNGIWTIVIILTVVGWTGIYRLVRAEYL